MTKAFLFDTETTGFVKTPVETQPLDVQPYLTQCYGVIIEHDEEGNYERLGTYSSYFGDVVEEGGHISKKITELTGVTKESLTGMPLWKDMREDFFKAVDTVDCVVAHNMKFDGRVIQVAEKRLGHPKPFQEVGRRCSLEMSRKLNKHAPSHALGSLIKFIFNEELENAHNAAADAEGLIRVYIDLVKKGGWKK